MVFFRWAAVHYRSGAADDRAASAAAGEADLIRRRQLQPGLRRS